jgi:hypothetical protein
MISILCAMLALVFPKSASATEVKVSCEDMAAPKVTLVRERKGGDYLDYKATGLPPGATWTTSTGTEVFRHYVNTPATLEAVLETKTLRAGNRPYVRGDKYTKIVHEDMVGIFVTTPEYTSGEVDGHSPLYVDFTFPAGTRILNIVPGILLLPGEASTPAWMLEGLAKWRLDPSSVPFYMQASLQKLDREPPRQPRTQLINVVGHSPIPSL